MRESASDSEGILRTGTLGHIRFFFALNQVAFENCLVEVVLPAFEQLLNLSLLRPSQQLRLYLFVLPTDLLPRTTGKVVLQQSKVWPILLDQLNC